MDGVLVNTRADLTTGNIDTDDLGYAVNVAQDGRGTYTDNASVALTNGVIDDVGIWTRALSGQEAAAIYQAGLAGHDLSQAVVATDGTLQVSLSAGTVTFTWVGATGVRLQRSTTLAPGSFTDVGGTLGNSTYSEPASSFTKVYYRLFKP